MTNDVVVEASSLSKRFKVYSGAGLRLLDWMRLPPRPRYQEFWALRNVSFDLRRGECLGVIGPNGAGKSTLLKLLTGTLHLTAGQLRVRGRVLSLLELGTGFNPDLTGRQNVQHSALLLGFPPGYARERMTDIEAFAELGRYFDQPVKLYSSGMFVRLAFSLFSAMEPEVFLVDEALAIGDLRFAGRALARIRQMQSHGTTLMFVSHDLQLINQLCTRAMWLHAGQVQMEGPPAEVTRAYQQFVVHGEVQSVVDHGSRTNGVGTHLALTTAAEGAGGDEVALATGWYPLEAFGRQIFRWAGQSADIVVVNPRDVQRELLLDVEPGPSAGTPPIALEVDLMDGTRLAHCQLRGRETIRIPVPPSDGRSQRLRVSVASGNEPVGADGRDLCVRLFQFGWSPSPVLQPVHDAREWESDNDDLDLPGEQAAMAAALRRCRPVARARARIVRVTTSRDGVDAVRFGSHDPFAIDITVEGTGTVHWLVVGVQIRDTHDRMLTGTRLDWLTGRLPAVAPGHTVTIRFATDDLTLGRGLYQLTVGCHEYPDSGNVFHWVDGAWRFEVIEGAAQTFVGQLDLGLHASVRDIHTSQIA